MVKNYAFQRGVVEITGHQNIEQDPRAFSFKKQLKSVCLVQLTATS